MFRRIPKTAIFFAAAIVLFMIANRASYRGYFMDDDLNALSWAKEGSVPYFLYWLALPRFHPENFRPVGAFYYRIVGGLFGLDYPPYVAILHVIHFINVLVLYLVLRRLKFSAVASAAGALFFMFDVATLEIYWKPMYVYDLLCAMFCLLTLLLYIRGNWILALVTFWLAYKSKEMAVMLPLALAGYEFIQPQRQWKRLIPYFLISLNFGLQGLLLNPNQNNDYAMHFALSALARSVHYYSAQLFFLPYLLVVAAILLRDRRLQFGLLTAFVLLFPLLALPGRGSPAYWYAPLIGISIAAAMLAGRSPQWLLITFFLAWFTLNYAILREKRRTILAASDDNRAYVAALADFARQNPEIQVFGYESRPEQMHEWGIEGAVHLFFGNSARVFPDGSPGFVQARSQSPAAVIHWRPYGHSWVQRVF